MTTGSCLCGAVTYSVDGAKTEVGVCHCEDCQRWIGGPFLGIEAETLDTQGPVRWYQSSEWGERGSCERCGSALFWRLRDGRYPVVTAGSLDNKAAVTGIKSHIFCDRKPAFFEFTDRAPRLTAEETLTLFMEQMKAEDA